MPELMPCPMANNHEAELIADIMCGWYVQCTTCGASGGPRRDKESAIEAWNTRPSHPDTEEAQRLRLRLQEMDAELVSLRGQLSARTGLRKELEDALATIQALKADTVRLEKLGRNAPRGMVETDEEPFWHRYNTEAGIDCIWTRLTDDSEADLRTALDALHGPTEEV